MRNFYLLILEAANGHENKTYNCYDSSNMAAKCKHNIVHVILFLLFPYFVIRNTLKAHKTSTYLRNFGCPRTFVECLITVFALYKLCSHYYSFLQLMVSFQDTLHICQMRYAKNKTTRQPNKPIVPLMRWAMPHAIVITNIKIAITSWLRLINLSILIYLECLK